MNNPNTTMPVSELIKKLAIDASNTLKPKENRTVIELPDIESMMGLLGNALAPNNVNMQPEVNDMPSYNMMLADNSNEYVDPYADAPGPTTEDLSPEQREFLKEMTRTNSMENYYNNLREYDSGYRGVNPVDSVPSNDMLNEALRQREGR